MNISSMNTSLACEVRRYIGNTPLDVDTEVTLRYLLIGFLILLFPFGIILHGFLLALIATVKTLHQTVYFLALQVLLIDLLLTLIASPITVINAFAGRWILGAEFCSLSVFALHLTRHVRYWVMFVLVSDRFATIFFPFSYPRHQTKFVVILSLLAWTVPFIFAVVPIALDCESFSRITFYCTGGDGCTDRYLCQLSRMLTTTITNVIGSLVPLILYMILFIKAKKMRNTLITMTTGDRNARNRRNNLRVNSTFFFLFLAVFGVNVLPFFLFIVSIFILSTLGIPSPREFVITTFVFRSLYNVLPIIDAITIMRNTDVQLAMKTFKARFFKKEAVILHSSQSTKATVVSVSNNK